MTPYNTIPQPVPMYAELAYQYARRRECTSAPATVFHSNEHLPFFVIRRATSAFAEWSLKLTNDQGDEVDMGVVLTRTATLPDPDSTDSSPLPDLDFVTVDPEAELPSPIPEGTWWMEWTDNDGVTFYSEPINFTSCLDDKIEIRFGDSCAKLDIPFQEFKVFPVFPDNRITFRMFSFWIDRGHGVPRVETNTEEEDNGKSIVVKAQTTIKKYVINELLPAYIIDALHASKYMASVEINDPSTGLISSGRMGSVTAEWTAKGCLANAVAEIQLDREWRDGCCDENFVVKPCGIEDAIDVPIGGPSDQYGWFSGEPNGTTYLILAVPGHDLSPFSEKLWHMATQTTTPDVTYTLYPVGSILRVNQNLLATDAGDIYNDTDTLFEVIADDDDPSGQIIVPLCPPPSLTNVGGNQVMVSIDYTTAAIIAMNRFARIYVSQSIEPGHESELLLWEGAETLLREDPPIVLNPYDEGQCFWRIEYYRHGCTYGLSMFTLLNCEPVFSILSLGDAPVTPAIDHGLDVIIFPCINGDTLQFVSLVDQSILGNPACGNEPRAIVVHQTLHLAFVACGAEDKVRVFDIATRTEIAAISVSDSPQSLALNPVTGMLYCLCLVPDKIDVIDVNDPNAITVVTSVAIGADMGLTSTERMVMNVAENKLYFGSRAFGGVHVLDGNTNTMIASINTGTAPNYPNLVLDVGLNILIVSGNNTNTLTFIDCSNDTVIASPTMPGVGISGGHQTIDVNQDTHIVYVALSIQPPVYADVASQTILGSATGYTSDAIKVDQTTGKVFSGRTGLRELDPDNMASLNLWSFNMSFDGIVIDEPRRTLYWGSQGGDNCAVLRYCPPDPPES